MNQHPPESIEPRWRDISSAPRDGTAIWIATAYTGHGTGLMIAARFFNKKWRSIYTEKDADFSPTHWQPLPKPPLPPPPDSSEEV